MEKESKEKPLQEKGREVTSESIPNAHASGDGALERSEENELAPAGQSKETPRKEPPY